ncbi:MAG: hypothetical protein M3348_02435 [Acidobacteriota bacterium]|nr:hypothetical protein [Acidobacteriota bacterium]
MKRKLLILALMIAALVWLPDAPAGQRGALSASAATSCSPAAAEACNDSGGYFDFTCCTCSSASAVAACEAVGGYWDYCSRTCT